MIGPGSVKNELKRTAEKLTLCLVVGKLRKQWKKKKLQNLLLPHQAIGRHQYFASPTSKKTTNLLKTNPAQILLFINLPLQDQCWWWTHSLPCRKLEKPPLPVFLFEYLDDVYFFKSISKYSYPIHPRFLSKIRLYLKGISKCVRFCLYYYLFFNIWILEFPGENLGVWKAQQDKSQNCHT